MGWVRITVKDLDTGEEESVEIENDYVLTCVGDCYLDATQVYRNGTHVLTVKGSNGRTHPSTPSTSAAPGSEDS